MKKVAENVYVETGFQGCNPGFVVTAGGIVMVDTPTVPSEAKKWRDEIAKYGEVVYIINTEPHVDHFAGSAWFGGTTVGHEGTRESILTAELGELEDMLGRMAPDELPLPPDFRFRPPEITLSQRLGLYIGNHSFKLIALPGHSPYEVAVYVLEERVVFTGDNVVNGTPPFMHQAVPDEWMKTLDYLEKLDVNVILPGHGEPCDKSYLPVMRKNLQGWIDAVKEVIARGMSLEEALEKVSVIELSDDHARRVQSMNVPHLYEIFKK
jgi:cyclase